MEIKRKISNRIKLSFGILIAVSTLGGILSYTMLQRVAHYYEAKAQVSEIVIQHSRIREMMSDFLLEGRKDIDFLEDGSSKLTRQIENSLDQINAILSSLKNTHAIKNANIESSILNLLNANTSYTFYYNKLKAAYFKRGFKDHGLEGEMRSYVHDVQELDSKEEQLFAFKMRRREKDYMLRLDTKYVDMLHDLTDEFSLFMQEQEGTYSTEYVQKAVAIINAYKNHFDRIVMLDKEIGFKPDEGIRGQIKVLSESIKPQIAHAKMKIDEASGELTYHAVIVLTSSILAMIIAASFFTYYLNKVVSRPIKSLDNLVRNISIDDESSYGELKVLSENKSEIGSLASNFRKMVLSIQDNLVEMQEKNNMLEQNEIENQKRSWVSEGLNLFNEITRKKSDLENILLSVLQFVIRYNKLNQGAIYILNEDLSQPRMEMKAYYAYDRQKISKYEFLPGEGLVGEVWREKETLYMTDIPNDYVRITSGIGEATPGVCIIIPMINDNTVEGIIELAGFQPIETHQVDFLENITTRLARNISAIKMHEKTSKLLEETQQMTEELRASEEEMRQNMEELQATQEEMSRNSNEMNQLTTSLKSQIQFYESVITKVYDGFVIVNNRGIIQYVNDNVLTLLKTDQDNLIGKALSRFLEIDFSKVAESLSNDNGFARNEFSHWKKLHLKDNSGDVIPINLVITKLIIEKALYYAFLFSEYDYSSSYKDNFNSLLNKSYVFSRNR